MVSFVLISQALALAGVSGTRAGLALLGVGLAAHTGYVELAPELAWLAQPHALAAFAVLLGAEMLMDRDEDLHALMGLVQYGVSGSSGALAVLGSLGVRMEGVPEWVLGTVGALLAMGVLLLRRMLHAQLADFESEVFHPLRWLSRVEEGGALGLVVAAFLAPVLALGVVVLAVVGGAATAVAARRWEARLRRDCPACGKSIRQEASRCRYCKAEVPVIRTLDLQVAGWAKTAVSGALGAVQQSTQRMRGSRAQGPTDRVG